MAARSTDNADLGIPDGQVVCTIPEAAEIIRCHERTIRSMIKDQRLKAAQHRRIIRIPVASIREFLGLRCGEVAEPSGPEEKECPPGDELGKPP